MTWLAVLAAFALTGCVVVVVTILRGRRRRRENAVHAEPSASEDAVDTRPYDVRACGLQALEALTEREHSVHQTTTRKYTVSLVTEDGLTTDDELALSLMAQDGLTVAVASGKVLLDSGRVRQTTEAHAVPPSLTEGESLMEPCDQPVTPACEIRAKFGAGDR